MKKLKYFLSFLLISTAFWLFTVLLIQINITNNKFKNDSWEKFDQLKLNKLINEKNIIFVDITADWCLTCFYNKTTVINRKKIKMIFNENKVIKMRGDITKPNKKSVENIAKLHPLKRIGQGHDAASLAKFLLSSDSSWITGQIIGVDGGRSAVA